MDVKVGTIALFKGININVVGIVTDKTLGVMDIVDTRGVIHVVHMDYITEIRAVKIETELKKRLIELVDLNNRRIKLYEKIYKIEKEIQETETEFRTKRTSLLKLEGGAL